MSSPVSSPVPARLLAGLVGAGVLDADLAALAWILLEDGIPVLVVGMEEVAREELLDALVAALPAGRLPNPTAPAGAGRLVRVSGTLATSTRPGTLRAALDGTTGRSGLAATIEGAGLAEALSVLHRQGLSDDEVSFLGTVVVLGPDADPAAVPPGPGQRVVAAHYLRPVARDAGGHVQRLAPAVLATWDVDHDAYDHFEWGIYPELAARTGRRAGDLEGAHRGRAEELRARAR